MVALMGYALASPRRDCGCPRGVICTHGWKPPDIDPDELTKQEAQLRRQKQMINIRPGDAAMKSRKPLLMDNRKHIRGFIRRRLV